MIVTPAVRDYLEATRPPADPLLAEMQAHGARERIPILDAQSGALLHVRARSALGASWTSARRSASRRCTSRGRSRLTVRARLVRDPPPRAFNERLLAHPELVATIMPVGDGIALAAKR